MWAQIRKEIFENDALDIYEKMCLLVLVSLEDDIVLSSEELARYMGCTVITAKRAFESLKHRGYFTDASETQDIALTRTSSESNVLSAGGDYATPAAQVLLEPVDHFRAGFFTDGTAAEEKETDSEGFHEMPLQGRHGQQGEAESLMERAFHREPESQPKAMTPEMAEKERRDRLKAYLLGGDDSAIDMEKPFVSIKDTKATLVDQVIDIIDEKISFKEANIILGFSGNDIELIKRKYKIAKMSQVSDTIGMLINELQKKDSNVIKAEVGREKPFEQVFDEEAPMEQPVRPASEQNNNTQVNTLQILRMQAYQKLKKDPKP